MLVNIGIYKDLPERHKVGVPGDGDVVTGLCAKELGGPPRYAKQLGVPGTWRTWRTPPPTSDANHVAGQIRTSGRVIGVTVPNQGRLSAAPPFRISISEENEFLDSSQGETS